MAGVGRAHLLVDHGRPFVEIEFPDFGRRAVAWLDTGGGPFIVGKRLGNDLGLVPVPRELDGMELEVVDLPSVQLGGRSVDVADSFARKADEDLITAGFPAEAFIPAHVLARHDVVLDYPGNALVLDGGAEPIGCRVPALSYPRPGWPVVTVTIAGEELNLLLDTGASCCMLSERVFDRLRPAVARSAKGAFGLANMSGGAFEAGVETVRLPDFAWGDLVLPSIVVVSRREGAFEQMMSSGTPVPVEGAIAGNLLRHLRLEWRSSEQAMWLEAPTIEEERVCQVPLVLHSSGGSVRIVGVGDAAERSGIRAGDDLVAIDGTSVAPETFGATVAALGGQPGQMRTITFVRDGTALDLNVPVIDIV